MTPPIDVDWDSLRSEWDDREIEIIRGMMFDLKLIPEPLNIPPTPSCRGHLSHRSPHQAPSSPSETLDSPETKLNKHLRAELGKQRTWLRAFETQGAAELLACFVFSWGMKMWELTSEHDEVRTCVASACNGYVSAYDQAKRLVETKQPVSAQQRERLHQYLNGEQDLVHLILDSLTMPVNLALSHMPTETPRFAALLLDAMSVESAVYGGSTTAAKRRASTIQKSCIDLYRDNPMIANEFATEIYGFLHRVVRVHELYYGCIAIVAEALEYAAEADLNPNRGFKAIDKIDVALAELERVRKALGEDVYASELPAYRLALRAWRERLTSPSVPIKLDSVKITYVYPFTLSNVDGDKAQQIALSYGQRIAADGSRSAQRPTFGGLPLSKPPQQEDLTDMWTWGGRRNSLNGTVKLSMPELTVQLPDDDRAECEYNVELRINDLGNHYLRLDVTLTDPTLNDINQSLRRVTTYSGEHDLLSDDGPIQGGHTTISAYAEKIIHDVAAWVTAESKARQRADRCKKAIRQRQTGAESTVHQTGPDTSPPSTDIVHATGADAQSESSDQSHRWRATRRRGRPESDDDGRETEQEDKSGFNSDFDYHVVVVIESASVTEPNGSRREADRAQISNGYESVFLQLLNREPTTLDEWICWGKSHPAPNLLGDACFPSDFSIGTQSTTVIYMPSTPSWARSGYEEVAEFAASFSPLIRARKNDLDEKFKRAYALTQKDDDHHIPEQEARLEALRSDLHAAVDKIQLVRTYLVPSQLLSLSAEGKYLEQLYTRSRLPELQNDIESYIERGRTTIDRMNAREIRLHDHRNRKSQNLIQTILLFVGICSISGVFSLLLTLYFGSSVPGEDTTITPAPPPSGYTHLQAVEAIGVSYLVFFVVSMVFFFLSKWRMRTRKRQARN